MGAFHAGAVSDCVKLLESIVKRSQNVPLKVYTAKIVRHYLSESKRIPGLGHRFHSLDPRAKYLLNLAQELELAGEATRAMYMLQKQLNTQKHLHLTINIDGAIAAIVNDLGLPEEAAQLFFILGRLPGLLLHYKDEKLHKPMRLLKAS